MMNPQRIHDVFWTSAVGSALVGCLLGVGFYLFFHVLFFGGGAR